MLKIEQKEIMETAATLKSMFGGGRSESPETWKKLLEDLPAEAIMGPKRDRDGNVLRTADANMTGYKPAYVIKAAVERLGAGGWVEACWMGEPTDVYLSRAAADAKRPDGVAVECYMLIYYPGLDTFRQAGGSGAQAVRGDHVKAVIDAQKAAQTNARKRCMALIGIGWKGYTDDMSPDDHGDEPPILPGRPKEPQKYQPPLSSKPPASSKPAPAPAPEPPRTFADAANAAAGPQAPAVDQGVEAAFQDVLELLAEDGLVAKTEKGIAWFRARAQDLVGFFDQGGPGMEERKVKLIERMNKIHEDRNRKLHARYREVFGEDEAGRRAWMKKVIGKDSTAACTTQERIRLLAELVEVAKGRN